jgi:hypothetical protein
MSYPKYGTSLIKCAGRGCDWTGLETDRITHPDDVGKFSQRNVCPKCHHTDYTFPRSKRRGLCRIETEVSPLKEQAS